MRKYKELLKLILISLISIVVYVLLFLLYLPIKLDILWCILLQLLGLPLSLFFFVFFHEFGHFVFGKISGYEFVTFKVGPFEWKNDDGKIKFNIVPQNMMILGQCLMSPPKPKKKKTPKFFLYNAGGLIFSYLQCITSILIVLFVPLVYIKWFILPIILVGLFLTLNNSLYSSNGVNDVCNHVFAKKNPKYIDSIMYQLEMLANVSRGKRYGAKCHYKGYYEEKLNHITIPVVQFRFYQAIEHNRFDEAKELSIVMRKNYSSMIFWMQKLAFYFEILWSDIVLEMNMNMFRRDFKKIGSKAKMFCQKEGTDVFYYYKIYERIYNGNFEVFDLLEEMLNQDTVLTGEELSMRKKMDFLNEKLQVYISNGNSFEKSVD